LRGIVGCVLMVLFFVTAAWAGEFGPPEPQGEAGQFSLGAGVWLDRSEMRLDGDRLKDTSTQYYVQGDWALIKDWEVYGRLGTANQSIYSHDLRESFFGGGRGFGTLGFKGVLFRQGNFALGPFVEGTRYQVQPSVSEDQWDANGGIAADYKIPVWSSFLTVYGGLFAYMHRAMANFADTAVAGSDEMSERHNFGGFLGLKVPVVAQKLFISLEAQLRDRLGAGASLSYTF